MVDRWWFVCCASCGLIYVCLQWQRTDKTMGTTQQPNPAAVRTPFDELVEAHKLDAEEITVLRQAVQQWCPSRPVLVFVDPDILSRHSLTLPEAAALRGRLFDGSQPRECQDVIPSDRVCPDGQIEVADEAASDCEVSIGLVAEELLEHLPRIDLADRPESLTVVGMETV
jgi:hypothetical protein